MSRWVVVALALVACTGTAEPTTTTPPPTVPMEGPPPPVAIPSVAWRLPSCDHKTRLPIQATPDRDRFRATLAATVTKYGLDPANAWAIGHALLALGPDAKLPDGENAIDHLFTAWAEPLEVGGETLVRFPTERDGVRIEPHSDLVLKVVTELGVKPDRPITVKGQPHTVGDLYRGSLARAWTDENTTGFAEWNDTPWALQALSAWAPKDLAWVADGGHRMTMDQFTDAVVGKLHAENAFIREAYAQRVVVEKRRQGIYGYTCGGAHLIQGAAYAVGRGFGDPKDKALVAEDVHSLFYRLNVEIKQVDDGMKANPEYAPLLLVQRLKFLGHFLETVSKASALGIWTPEGNEAVMLDRAADEVVRTVDVMEKVGIFTKLEEVRPKNEQFYLDVIGDSAHAVRGLDLATGRATLCY